ncbi:beta-xylosidase 1 [Striga asiatica]|uniref:Beta-xylosidase 1 n=1 Tax=Striga asiatica TaxID=4170 RepID=A0A5A7Q5W1_STRAF|nr:beta-xylosidase 1 [Striga asiatica]
MILRGMTLLTLFLCAQSAAPPFSCDSSKLPLCDARLPIGARVKDLVSRLSLDEKIQQLVNTAASIPRLNISAYEWWSEALHGISRHGKGINFGAGPVKSATMFPQVILTAASFDANLWYRVAQAIGEEGRAVYNAGQAKGLTFWAPNINIFRDPRWGRGQETPGEDPLVAGKYSVAYVRGIQGDSFEGGELKDGRLKASACCKHYTAHDLDNWKGVTRYVFDAKVSKQDLADTYQPPFRACVEEGRASGIMCAYNRVNGVPSCADYNLLTETARKQWGFQGYIVSDCDAVAVIHDQQGYAKQPEDAVADVLQAGMDIDCGSYLLKHTNSAVARNKTLEQHIDRALTNLFSIRIRLGLFNGDPSKLEYGKISPAQICSKAHLDLALEAAQSGIVLLKNDAKLLPFQKAHQNASIAVIGPHANSTEPFLGNYEGFPCGNTTILEALQKYNSLSTVRYHPGCESVNCTSDRLIDEAVSVAKEADYVVMVMGLDQTIEREKLDRLELGLPGNQENFVIRVAKVAKRPLVLVLLCGGPVDVSFAKENPKIGGILWAGYPGEAGGVAVAQTLFGDNNPGGKLPVTWYPKEFVRVAMTDMRMRPEPSTYYPGRTYRFYTGPKVFEFGHGLSYTEHSYEFVSVKPHNISVNRKSGRHGQARSATVSGLGAAKACKEMKLEVQVKVKNRGDMESKHAVLLFVRDNKGRRLVGFQSVSLREEESKEIGFVVRPCEHLSRANEDGVMVIEEGTLNLEVGDEVYTVDVFFPSLKF